MTPKDFATLVRTNTLTDSTSFPDAQLLLLMNLKAVTLAKRIESVKEDFFGMLYTRDLVATATSREYNLPDTLQDRFARVEAKLDGTNWVVLTPLDLLQYERTTDEATILLNFSNDEKKAFYDVFRNSLWLYTGEITGTVTGGLKLWGYGYPTKITDLTGDTTDLSVPLSTTGITIPKLFHEVWADMVSANFKQQQERPIPLNEREVNIEFNLQKLLESLSDVDLDQQVLQEEPNDKNADDGFNY